jgi:hypothetical protein
MDANTLIASLQDAVPGAPIEGVPSVDLQTTIYVGRDELPAIARSLKDRPELAFNLLAEITAVDFWPREPRFELVYILVSIPNRLRLRMKVRLPGGDARVATVIGVGRRRTGSSAKSGTCSASSSRDTRTCGACCCPKTGKAIPRARTIRCRSR